MFEESVSFIPSIWASVNSWFTPTVLFVLLNLVIGTIAIISSLGSQKHHESGERSQGPPQLARSPSVLQRLKSINFYSYRSQEPTTNFQKSPETETNYDFRQAQEQEQPHLFTRSPSNMLQKLKSINLYSYISQEFGSPQPTAAAPAQIETLETESTHFEFEREDPKEEEEEEEGGGGGQFEDYGDQSKSLDEIYSQLKGAHVGHVSRSKSDTKPAAGEYSAKLSKKMKKSASAKSAFAHFEEAHVVESRRPATVREGKAKETEVDDEVDAKADDFINRFKQQLKLQRLDSIIRSRR